MRRIRLVGAALLLPAVLASGCGTPTDIGSTGGMPTSPTPVPTGPAEPARTIHTAPSCRGLPGGPGALPCLGPGPAVDLGAIPGPTVVAVWASWCEPCRRELPVLQEYADQGGSVLGVDVADDPRAAADLLDALGVTIPSVQDVDSSTRTSLGWIGPPANFVVRDGMVVHRITESITDVDQLRVTVSRL